MSKFVRIFVGLFCVLCLVQGVFAATYTVTKTTDSNDGVCDSDCSLRESVAAANGTVDNDIVSFDAVLFSTAQTINLTLGEIVIANNGSLTINGTGANILTIDGNNSGRIISTSVNGVATINDATFTRGTGVGAANTGRAGAIYNNGGNLTLNNLVITGNTANNGGGTNNAGTGSVMTINNCIISNNTSTSSGGGMQNFSTSTLTINNSTISGNTSGGSTGGGAMQANGIVRITNSTLTRNNAPGGSGGAIAYNGTSLILTNVTISGNTSTTNGGGVHKSTSTLNAFWRNTIVAGNTGAAGSPDVTGVISSEGNNIIGNVGTSSGWIGSDLVNTNPLLAPLGFYGGKGLTYLPLNGSPAINAGQNCVTDLTCATNNPPTAVTTDQRGATRPTDTTIDIGAVETSSNYVAVLPTATLSQPYNFTLANNFTDFVFLPTSGTFGGILLVNNGNSAILDGTSNQLGTYNVVVAVTNNVNSTNINYSLTVSAVGSNVLVNGKILDSSGNSVRGAIVGLTDAGNVTRYARTNSFGNFSFSNVPFGGNYTLNASSKGLTFNPLNFTVNAAPMTVNLTASNSNFNELQK